MTLFYNYKMGKIWLQQKLAKGVGFLMKNENEKNLNKN